LHDKDDDDGDVDGLVDNRTLGGGRAGVLDQLQPGK
jgi:hypothetical protein